MKWSDLGAKVASAGAQVLGGLISGGPVGAGLAAVRVVATELGVPHAEAESDPSVLAHALDRDPKVAARLREIESAERVRLRELSAELAKAELLADRDRIDAVNETIRAELASPSGYRAGWRPAFGYLLAISWGWVMFAIGFLLIERPADAPAAITAVANLFPMWSVALAVVGVSVIKRTEDKRVAAGAPTGPSLTRALVERIAKR